MSIPENVTVGPYVYSITSKAKHFIDEGDAYGSTDFDKLRIRLRPKLPYQLTSETLLHEVLHTVLDVAGVTAEIGREKDEEYTRRLTPYLLEVLRDNPTLVLYLLGGGEAS